MLKRTGLPALAVPRHLFEFSFNDITRWVHTKLCVCIYEENDKKSHFGRPLGRSPSPLSRLAGGSIVWR